jgi:hypothetical protein
MGHIKEPDGVDFIIKSRPLTKEEEAAISKYIKAYNEKHPKKKSTTRKKTKLRHSRAGH